MSESTFFPRPWSCPFFIIPQLEPEPQANYFKVTY